MERKMEWLLAFLLSILFFILIVGTIYYFAVLTAPVNVNESFNISERTGGGG